MTDRGPSLLDIKAMLQANIEALVRTLLPAGSRSGKWWLACNPTRDDQNASLGVGLTGTPGAWKDFASGDKGDVFDLIQYVNGFPPMRDDIRPTIRWARAYLGIEGAAPAVLSQKLESAKADAERRTRADAERRIKNARRAKAIFLDSKKPAFAGSPAARYLGTRGLDLSRLSRLPGSLGWVPQMWHSETDTYWPAMIAGFTAANGETIAVHRTYLARDGNGKAPVTPQRKIWPAFEGAAIRLWRGATELSIDDAAKQGLRETLVLVEGVEDGLAIALSAPQFRVWCAGSLSNIGNITLPECVDEVIVCADNDWGKAQAQALLERGLAALEAQGRNVRVARSTRGKDVNDALVA